MSTNGKLELTELSQLISSGEIDTVLVCFPDLQGRLLGKRVTGHFFLSHGVDELHVCDYLLALDMEMTPVPGYKAASWELGYGDFAVRPDMSTLRRVAWLPATAIVLGDCTDPKGNDLPHAPRSVLKGQVARARALGYEVMMGSELEFYLFDESYESAHEKRYQDLKTASRYSEDYHILQTSKEEGLIRAIRNAMDSSGVPVEFSKGEWGPGQEEINLRYADALEMADRHTLYKNGAKEIAHAHGKAVSFMPKWRADLAGNSCHIHSSLWDAKSGEALCFDASDAHGMSRLCRQFLAGQLALAREMTYFLAPTINAYKRFQSGSFAPTSTVWAVDNRTVGFRVVGAGPARRIECRIPGGDANPYLAFAALIAAGLHGIESALELEPAFEGDAYEGAGERQIPKTLREALTALEGSQVLRDALGEDVVEHYLHTGRWEQREYDRCVTDWELQRYFERV